MKKLFKYILIACSAVTVMGLSSCSDDDDVNTSISVIKDDQTPQNDLDKWLEKNFVEPYNVQMRYRWEDNEIDMDYILVPASYENSVRIAKLLKYICFDAFDEVTGSTKFIRDYFPKQVQLVGNPGWQSNGSYTLGSAEGGARIDLWYVNHLSDVVYDGWTPKDSVIRDRNELNKVYFHTIMHEFCHVFNQKVPFSTEFNQITGTNYRGGSWNSSFSSETDPEIYASGFITAYASYSANEDFAECFATYICCTPEEFQSFLDKAGTTGRATLVTKMNLVKNYFADNWNLDLDAVRNAVQKREANLKNQNFDDISL